MMATRWPTVLLVLLIAGASGTALTAQTARPQDPPGEKPPVEATVDRTPVEQESDSRRVRFRQPIVRILQNYTLRRDDAVRHAVTIFGDATIEGRVLDNVVVVLGSARVTGTGGVGGSLVVVGGNAYVEEGATVGGDLVVVGGTLIAPPDFSPDGEYVVIGTPWFGEITRDMLPWLTRGLLWGRLIVADLEWIWAVVAVFFLVYLGLNTVLDRPVGATADVIVERPLSAFLAGLLVLLLSVPVLVIVSASVVGLAIVPFLLCGVVVATLIGKTAVARALGRSVVRAGSPEGRAAAFLAFLVGSVALTLAYMVPLLGFVTWALTSVLGLGGATATFRSHLRRERKVPAPVPEAALAPVRPPEAAAAEAPPIVPPPVEPVAAPVEPPPPSPIYRQGLAQYPRATFLDRLAAFTLDCVLVAIANALLDMQRHDGFFFMLLLGYHIAFWAWKGTTLGGIICSLRVTRTDGTDLRFVDSLVRGLSSIFSIAALGIGCLWMLQDPERQMWHDKIAGTLVVKVPREVVLP
jgi:uncharacterized RDD family membrane protein YckC